MSYLNYALRRFDFTHFSISRLGFASVLLSIGLSLLVLFVTL